MKSSPVGRMAPASAALAASAPAASTPAASERASSGKVTITVAGLLPGAEGGSTQLAERVNAFEGNTRTSRSSRGLQVARPTFAAQLAGGTLPNVFEIPLTDGKTLIENGQLADIDEQVKALPVRRRLQPEGHRQRQRRRRQDLRAADRRSTRSRCTTTATVQAGRARPRQAADDLGRGPGGRQDIHDKTGTPATRDGARQHRWLDLSTLTVRPRRPHRGRHRRRHAQRRWTTRRP